MKQYLIRLDDASEYMDLEKWYKIERLLDEFSIRPIFGIIPKNEDPEMTDKYQRNTDFWNLVNKWIIKGWIPAMHGYEHKYVTEDGGINPVNKRSEFAGLSYKIQARKIREGYTGLKEHGIQPEIFFAPSHTFDLNTLKALYNETPIRIISDTIASDVYYRDQFYFIPQQSGRVRNLPFKTVTFCYHPNTMCDEDFVRLKKFLQKSYGKAIIEIDKLMKKKKLLWYDKILQMIYFNRRERMRMKRKCTLNAGSM